jgi:pimeloyl-ACP methyl ester carboxylesterase
MAERQFMVFHGWGFDHTFWQPWTEQLSEWGKVQCYDRGYFGDSNAVEPDEKIDQTVLITHSFGLHWVEPLLLEQADLLIICGGFLYFHPYAAQYKRRSRLIVQEMINNLEKEPEKVLHSFYENCYAPDNPPQAVVENLNQQQLLDDLRRLQNSDLNHQHLKEAEQICIIHGSDDHLVPNKKGRQMYAQLQSQAQYFEIKGAGHALPQTHYEQCLEFIAPEIVDVSQRNSN